MKNFSFKRFVTFGLGLGMFMSAASGFAQSNVNLPAGNTITGGSGTAGVITIDATGKGLVVLKEDSLQVDGSFSAANGKVAVDRDSGAMTTSSTIKITGRAPDGQNGLYIGEAGKTNTRIDVTGAIYGPAGATGSNNYRISAAGGAEFKGGVSVGSLETSNKQFTVNGTTGAVETKAGITAAQTQFNVNGADGSVSVGAGNKIYLNGTNGKVIASGGVQSGSGGGSSALQANGFINVTQNAYIGGVTMANGGLYVDKRKDLPAGAPSLQVNGSGSVTQGATDINGNVADGSIIANGTDLNRIANNAATATALVQTNLVATNGRVTALEDKTTAQSYTAPADPTALGTTEFASNVTVSGTTTTDSLTVDGNANTGSIYNRVNIINGGEVNTKDLVVTGATTTNGIDNSGKTITNLADGVAVTDAATVGQVNAVQTNLDATIGTLSGASAGVSDAGAVTPTAPIATGTGSVTTQLSNVVNSTAAAVNNTNARVTGVESRVNSVETKTQNITATAGQTKVTGALEVTGNITTGTISAASGTIANGSRRVNPDGSVYFESNAIANGSDVMAEASKRKLEITRVDGRIDATNTRVTNEVSRLDNVKADKTAVAGEVSRLDGRITTETTIRTTEIARVDGRIDTTNIRVTKEVARVDGRINKEVQDRIDGDAATLNQANAYTDNAVQTEADARIAGDAALGSAIAGTNVRITQEVTRLDGRIDGLGADLSNEVTERKTEIKRVDKRIDTEAKTRSDADIAINKRIDVESTERKADVFNLNNRVDQEIVDRVEGDRQTLESANAHTNQQVSNERDRALAAEAGLNRHINGLGAMTMAANAVAHTANPGNNKTSVGVGLGSYGGETAVAVGATHTRHIEVEMSGEKRPVMVRYGATLSKSRASRTGFGVGASFSW